MLLPASPYNKVNTLIVVLSFTFVSGCWFSSAEPPPVAAVQLNTYEKLPSGYDAQLALGNENSRADSSLSQLSIAIAAYEKILEDMGSIHNKQSEELEVKWRLLRTLFWVSEKTKDKREKLRWIVRGENEAEAFIAKYPKRVEGYYYDALLKGRRAENMTIGLSAIKLVKAVEKQGLKAKSISEFYDNAGVLRLLAMLYAKAPAWPSGVGDIDLAIETAQRAIELYDYPMNWLIMAEIYIEDDETDKAIQLIEKVLSAPKVGDWSHEGETWRPYASNLLKQISQ